MPFFDQYPYTNLHNVNLDWILQRVKEWGELVERNDQAFKDLQEAWEDFKTWLLNEDEEFKQYVTTYLENLDVQEEINIKLEAMLRSGQLDAAFQPYISPVVTNWLSDHIEPTSPPVDTSLTIAGAAADSKTVGDKFAEIENTSSLEKSLAFKIIQCLNHVVFDGLNGRTFYEELKRATYPAKKIRDLQVSYNPNGHTYYLTDSVDSLRQFLSVTLRYQDGTSTPLTEYDIYIAVTQNNNYQCQISYAGFEAIFVLGQNPGKSNILYEWNFKQQQSLIDERRGVRALIRSGYNQVDPFIDSNGLNIVNPQGCVFLLDDSIYAKDSLYGKSIQIKFGAINFPGSGNIQVLTFVTPLTSDYQYGLVYHNANGKWGVYCYNGGSGSAWGSDFTETDRQAFNNATVTIYINARGFITLYINGVSKGTTNLSIGDVRGLALGSLSANNMRTAIIESVKVIEGVAIL